EEGRERLARSGGGRDERMAALADERPAVELRRGGLSQPGLEPGPHGGVEGIERGRGHNRTFYRLGGPLGNTGAGAGDTIGGRPIHAESVFLAVCPDPWMVLAGAWIERAGQAGGGRRPSGAGHLRRGLLRAHGA